MTRPVSSRLLALLAALSLLALPLPAAAEPTAGSISGTVTVPDGFDVTEVEVWALGSGRRAHPDATGWYEITDLQPGQYVVDFTGPSPLYREYWDDCAYITGATRVNVAEGTATSGIDAELQVGASVTGRVTVPPGHDVTSVRVKASPGAPLTPPSGTASVAADGSYTIVGLAPGAYSINFSSLDPTLAPETWPNVMGDAVRPRYDLVAGQVWSGVDADLEVGGRITGAVLAPDGLSATGATISVRSMGNRYSATNVTDDGTFVIEGLPPATYTVRFEGTTALGAEYWEKAIWPEQATAFPLELGETVSNIVFDMNGRSYVTLSGPGGARAGTPVSFTAAVSASGDQVPTGDVTFSLRDGTMLGTVPLTAGSATIVIDSLPIGSHVVRATYSGDASTSSAGHEAAVTIWAPPAPYISGVEPPSGPYLGGTRVTVLGGNFTGATAVTFGGTPGTDLVVGSDNTIQVTAPAGAVGVLDVAVTTAGGTNTPSTAARFSNVAVVAQTPVRAVADWSVPRGAIRCVSMAGKHGVPAQATGLMLNVTTVRPTGPGYVVVYPDTAGTGATPAPNASTVNFEPGADVANGTFVALGDNGKICYSTRGAAFAGVLIDVSGYTLEGSGIVLQAPTRLLDTRSSGPDMTPTKPRRIYTVKVAGQAGVPDDARAVLLNVTVQGGSGIGHLRVFPAGTAIPSTSVLNYAPGQDKANGAIVNLGADGSISFWSDTDQPVGVILDVLGYVAAESAYTPVTPTRVYDTREPGRLVPASRTGQAVVLRSVAGVPPEATAVVLNVTAIRPLGVGNLRVYPEVPGGPVPGTSTINYIAGRDIPNQVVVALPASGRITVYNDMAPFGFLDFAVDVVGYFSATSS